MISSDTHFEAAAARILLVDDHPVVRLGFSQLLSREPDLTICGEAESIDGAISAVETLLPDLVIVDISLQGESGLRLIHQVHESHPKLPMLVCSMHDEALFAGRALAAGARGYIGKREAADDLVTAVRAVLAGKLYQSARLRERLERAGRLTPGPPEPMAELSNRELEVFGMIGRGLGTREIAERMGIAFKTVETYRENIKQKLAIASGPALAERAVAWVLGQA